MLIICLADLEGSLPTSALAITASGFKCEWKQLTEAMALSPERSALEGLSLLRMDVGVSQLRVTLTDCLGFLLSVPQIRNMPGVS